ncbi:hypothetical protein EV360DRAFT_81674 [Lentinula raphanica]|nr:hypothetical protein EV360DRAFT_81674 [Lentinula raphanica]
MAPIIHYAVFPTSHVSLDRFPSLKKAYGQLNKAEGHIKSFYGLQVTEEGSKQMYFISSTCARWNSSMINADLEAMMYEVWESSLYHRKFKEISMINRETDIAKEFNPLNEAVAAAGEHFFHHEFKVLEGTNVSGLESENTEFVLVTPKAGAPVDKVREVGLKVRELWDNKGHPATFSESVQGNGSFLMVVGWSSTTHHLDTVKDEPYASLVTQFSEVGVFNMSHANLEGNK